MGLFWARPRSSCWRWEGQEDWVSLPPSRSPPAAPAAGEENSLREKLTHRLGEKVELLLQPAVLAGKRFQPRFAVAVSEPSPLSWPRLSLSFSVNVQSVRTLELTPYWPLSQQHPPQSFGRFSYNFCTSRGGGNPSVLLRVERELGRVREAERWRRRRRRRTRCGSEVGESLGQLPPG